MRYFLSSLLFLFLLNGSLSAQHGILPDTVRVKQGARLPCSLKESSGLAFYDGLLWSFNDSGGKPVLYGLHPESGKMRRKVKIAHPNTDWESIAVAQGCLWVGDVGNNRGMRDDLVLLQVAGKDMTASGNAIPQKTIHISYPEASFPRIKGKGHNRDCEAIAFVDAQLHLFTKNRLDEQSFILRLDTIEGAYIAKPTDTLEVGMMVTGADYNAAQDMMVLTGYAAYRSYLAFIPDYLSKPDPSSRLILYYLRGMDGAQIEAVSFLDDHNVVISTEKTGAFVPRLFYLNTQRLVLPTGMRPDVCLESTMEILSAFADPVNSSLHYTLNRTGKDIKMEVISFRGKRYFRRKIGEAKEGFIRSAKFGNLPLDQPLFLRIKGDGVFFSHRITLP